MDAGQLGKGSGGHAAMLTFGPAFHAGEQTMLDAKSLETIFRQGPHAQRDSPGR
jgi:hypothetical protein